MRGRWAAGIVPRNFAWIIKDRLAVSERPGGYAPNHRKVRRQEELLWLRAQSFSRIVSLLPSSHNLHAYDEFNLAWSHFALPTAGRVEAISVLNEMYPAIHGWLAKGERVLVHQDELGDRLMGAVAGYILWSGRLDGPQSIAVVEQILSRQMGSAGRVLVALVPELVAPPERPSGPAARSGQ
ncbi:MAG: hypothetical protein ACRD0Z_03645 [Acidimicrobiales bacterium]